MTNQSRAFLTPIWILPALLSIFIITIAVPASAAPFFCARFPGLSSGCHLFGGLTGSQDSQNAEDPNAAASVEPYQSDFLKWLEERDQESEGEMPVEIPKNLPEVETAADHERALGPLIDQYINAGQTVVLGEDSARMEIQDYVVRRLEEGSDNYITALQFLNERLERDIEREPERILSLAESLQDLWLDRFEGQIERSLAVYQRELMGQWALGSAFLGLAVGIPAYRRAAKLMQKSPSFQAALGRRSRVFRANRGYAGRSLAMKQTSMSLLEMNQRAILTTRKFAYIAGGAFVTAGAGQLGAMGAYELARRSYNWYGFSNFRELFLIGRTPPSPAQILSFGLEDVPGMDFFENPNLLAGIKLTDLLTISASFGVEWALLQGFRKMLRVRKFAQIAGATMLRVPTPKAAVVSATLLAASLLAWGIDEGLEWTQDKGAKWRLKQRLEIAQEKLRDGTHENDYIASEELAEAAIELGDYLFMPVFESGIQFEGEDAQLRNRIHFQDQRTAEENYWRTFLVHTDVADPNAIAYQTYVEDMVRLYKKYLEVDEAAGTSVGISSQSEDRYYELVRKRVEARAKGEVQALRLDYRKGSGAYVAYLKERFKELENHRDHQAITQIGIEADRIFNQGSPEFRSAYDAIIARYEPDTPSHYQMLQEEVDRIVASGELAQAIKNEMWNRAHKRVEERRKRAIYELDHFYFRGPLEIHPSDRIWASPTIDLGFQSSIPSKHFNSKEHQEAKDKISRRFRKGSKSYFAEVRVEFEILNRIFGSQDYPGAAEDRLYAQTAAAEAVDGMQARPEYRRGYKEILGKHVNRLRNEFEDYGPSQAFERQYVREALAAADGVAISAGGFSASVLSEAYLDFMGPVLRGASAERVEGGGETQWSNDERDQMIGSYIAGLQEADHESVAEELFEKSSSSKEIVENPLHVLFAAEVALKKHGTGSRDTIRQIRYVRQELRDKKRFITAAAWEYFRFVQEDEEARKKLLEEYQSHEDDWNVDLSMPSERTGASELLISLEKG